MRTESNQQQKSISENQDEYSHQQQRIKTNTAVWGLGFRAVAAGSIQPAASEHQKEHNQQQQSRASRDTSIS